MARRLAVIGAGPMGLAAALSAAARGWDVRVFEAGRVGEHLRAWGDTPFFTPLGMNLPAAAKAALGPGYPGDDVLLTGPAMAERVLVPLARAPALAGKVSEGHRVVAVGRAGLSKGAYAGHPLRAEKPFRLLVEGPEGEATLEAEAVLDASGTYGHPNRAGAGGLPARGERAAAGRILRRLGELRPRELEGARVLLLGHGHSAAHALLALEGIPGVSVTWMVRTPNRRPCAEVARDPLPAREALAARANALAEDPPAWLRVERRAQLLALEAAGPGGPAAGPLRAIPTRGEPVDCDLVLAFTGYGPDHALSSELHLDLAPATGGAGGLYRALSGITDCLAVPALSPADFRSGEPGFHLIGAKSYGRANTFLLRNGLEQSETVLDGLGRPA